VGDEQHPLTAFDFTMDHSRDGPSKFLGSFRGYLQADAANLYDRLYTESGRGIIEVACWMHARRKFFEARDKDRLRAETALAWIAKLYEIEKGLRVRCAGEWRELPFAERAKLIAVERQGRSLPLLADFQAWLEIESPKLVPKNPVREAMDYARGNWPALARYTANYFPIAGGRSPARSPTASYLHLSAPHLLAPIFSSGPTGCAGRLRVPRNLGSAKSRPQPRRSIRITTRDGRRRPLHRRPRRPVRTARRYTARRYAARR
jgi:hypothetical protein